MVLIKSVNVIMIITVSFHYQQCDNFWNIQEENAMWTGAVICVWHFTVHLSSGTLLCRYLLHLSGENIHTYIPRIRKCVTKTILCGTSQKYTDIHNFYSVRYYQHFRKQYYISSLHIKNESTDFISTFCLLLVKWDLNQSADIPRIPAKHNIATKI